MNLVPVKLRRAERGDVAVLCRLSTKLARQHADYDAQRFTLPGAIKAEFEQFFLEQLSLKQVAITLAELDGEVVGYIFVRAEPASLVELLEPSAWIHDLYVEEHGRGHRIGTRLLAAARNSAREFGSTSLMLAVSPKNHQAQAVFRKHGFRLTMNEMRLEL